MSLIDPKELEIPSLMTMSNRLCFRTSSCLDKQDHSKFFYLAQYDLNDGKFSVRRVANPLCAADIEYLESHGIEGFEVSEAAREIKKQDDFFRNYANAGGETNFTAMANAFLELDDYMVHPKDGSKSFVALPEDYIKAETELLGAFHIRKYIIEHGSIASRVNPATRKSEIHMLGDLAKNAFSPIILTDLKPEEWHYATRRVNSMTPPAPIYLRTPYDALPLADTDSWKSFEPIMPLRIDVKKIIAEATTKAQNIAAMEALENASDEAAAQMPQKSRLSTSQQAFIMEALLTEDGDIAAIAPKWLETLKKDQDFILAPSDLKDKNGPLGTLFYMAVHKGKVRYGFEALPALLNHFNAHGFYTTLRDIEATKLRGKTLMDYMRKASEQGISAPFDVVNSPLTRGLRP
jgi:hypothetical protein